MHKIRLHEGASFEAEGSNFLFAAERNRMTLDFITIDGIRTLLSGGLYIDFLTSGYNISLIFINKMHGLCKFTQRQVLLILNMRF